MANYVIRQTNEIELYSNEDKTTINLLDIHLFIYVGAYYSIYFRVFFLNSSILLTTTMTKKIEQKVEYVNIPRITHCEHCERIFILLFNIIKEKLSNLIAILRYMLFPLTFLLLST